MNKWTTSNGGDSYELCASKNHEDIAIKLHHYLGCGSIWFVTCHALGISRLELGDIPVDKAQDLAYNVVKTKAKQIYEGILSMDGMSGC